MFIYLLSVTGFCYFSSLLFWQYTEELGWLMIPILNAKLHIRQEMFILFVVYIVSEVKLEMEWASTFVFGFQINKFPALFFIQKSWTLSPVLTTGWQCCTPTNGYKW